MTTIAQIILAIALVLSIILPFGYYLIGEKNCNGDKHSSKEEEGVYTESCFVTSAVFFTDEIVAKWKNDAEYQCDC